MSIWDDDLAHAQRLLDALGTEHPEYLDAHTLFERLEENISNTELYGETEEQAAARAQIRRELNKISLRIYKLPIDQLGGNPAPSIRSLPVLAKPASSTRPRSSMTRKGERPHSSSRPSKDASKLMQETPGIALVFGNIERACNQGDLSPGQGQTLKSLLLRGAMRKQKGERAMPPSNPENTTEMFSYASQVLVYDLLTLSGYHAEWPHLAVSDQFKKDSIKLLNKMQAQLLVSSALVQQATKSDYSNELESILTPLRSLKTLLKNIDDCLLSGSIPFHISSEIEKHFDDLTYHLNKYLLVLHELSDRTATRRRVQ